MQARHLRSSVSIGLLLVALGACSDDGTVTAPPSTGSTTILVGNFDGPGVGDPVIHQAPDGTIISTTATDAAGHTSVELSGGDMITIANSWLEGSMWLQTIVGVEPGDDLRFFWAEAPPTGPTETIVTTGVMPEPVDMVSFSTGCWTGRGNFTLPRTSTSSDACAPNTGLLNMCWETEFEDVKQAFASVIDMPFDPSGTTTIDLTSRWRTDWQTVELALPKVPDGPNAVSLTPWEERDGATYNRLETLNTSMGGTVPAVHMLTIPRGFPESLKITFSVIGESQSTYLGERFTLGEQTAALGFSVTPVKVTTDTIQFAAAGRPAFSWTARGANIDTDYIMLELSWVADTELVSWTFYLPPGMTSFQVPELPGALTAYRPPVASVANEMGAYMIHGGDTDLEGYDHFRSVIFSSWPFEENAGGQPGRYFETSRPFDTPFGNNDQKGPDPGKNANRFSRPY